MDAAARAASVRAGNGDAAVSFLQRGGVVHPVAGHADNVAALLQHVHDMELMFGEYLGETVGSFDGFRRLGRFVMLYVAQKEASRIDVPIPNFLAVSWAMAS